MIPKDLDDMDKFKLRENHSAPDLAKDKGQRNNTAGNDMMSKTIDNSKSQVVGLLTPGRKDLRNAFS
jgi:hypothetical protein